VEDGFESSEACVLSAGVYLTRDRASSRRVVTRWREISTFQATRTTLPVFLLFFFFLEAVSAFDVEHGICKGRTARDGVHKEIYRARVGDLESKPKRVPSARRAGFGVPVLASDNELIFREQRRP